MRAADSTDQVVGADQLVGAVDVDRFAVVGIVGGGPHVLVVAVVRGHTATARSRGIWPSGSARAGEDRIVDHLCPIVVEWSRVAGADERLVNLLTNSELVVAGGGASAYELRTRKACLPRASDDASV